MVAWALQTYPELELVDVGVPITAPNQALLMNTSFIECHALLKKVYQITSLFRTRG